jgi:hypothetical protein
MPHGRGALLLGAPGDGGRPGLWGHALTVIAVFTNIQF